MNEEVFYNASGFNSSSEVLSVPINIDGN